jgi:hypothetical protein
VFRGKRIGKFAEGQYLVSLADQYTENNSIFTRFLGDYAYQNVEIPGAHHVCPNLHLTVTLVSAATPARATGTVADLGRQKRPNGKWGCRRRVAARLARQALGRLLQTA